VLFLSKLKKIVHKTVKTVAKMQLKTSNMSKYVLVTVKYCNYKLLGISTSAVLLALYRYLYLNNLTPTGLICASQYSGLEGLAGQYLEILRNSGSRVIFDLTRTISTFSNAAIAGFLEPKVDLVRSTAQMIQDNQDSLKGPAKQILDSIKEKK